MSTVPPARPSTRPVAASDDAFLFELYASTRAGEMAAWGWSAAQQEPFLRMQWMAQKRGYEARFPSEGHVILELEGKPVGRLWVVRGEHELLLVDVTLLPAYQGSGLGTSLLRSLQGDAAAAGRPLRLHVLRNNPALRLYTRLGFTPVAGQGEGTSETYLSLEWGPR